MNNEVLLALIFKKVEERLNALSRPSRGARGQRGQAGTPGENGKDFCFAEHSDTIKGFSERAAIEFSQENVDLLRGARGRDGRDGRDGTSILFSDHEEQFKRWARDFALKFEDLTTEQIESLRGSRGTDGRDGKSFNFSDHEDQFKTWAQEFALKFEDLTLEQIEKLRGARGRDGRDGKDFDFEASRESITELVSGMIGGMKDSLKLRFSDLSAEDIEQIRGARGRDGRDGKNFEFEEHKEFFLSLKPKFSDFTEQEKSELKLHFSQLTDQEKSELKLRFDDLSEDDRLKLRGGRGPRGQRGSNGKDGDKGDQGIQGVRGLPGAVGPRGISVTGKDGRDGRDGRDGQDAPFITDIKADQNKQGEFTLVFIFSDGTQIETGSVKIPRNNVFNSAGGSATSGGGSGGGGLGLIGVAKKAEGLVGTFSAGDTTYTLPEIPISDDELTVWLDGVMRTDYVLTIDEVVFVGQDTTGQVFDAQLRYGVSPVPSTGKKANALVGIFASGDTTYTLPELPISEDELVVWLNGIMRTDYDLVGYDVTFIGQDTTGQVFDAQFRY